ncbi:MAG: hypothetical protein Q8O89_07960 [Nanoarchaeota archaeon]|nr:hypothetical protein [Nanoarchaeota archaeon]
MKNTFIPKEIVAFALFLFGISWIIKGLLGLLGISNLLIIVLFSMCISILILKNLKKKLNELIIAGIIFSILRIVIDKNALTLFSIAATAAALVIWLFFFRFFFNVSENIFVKKVGLNNVKIGQVVSKKFELNVKKHKITIEKSRKLSKKDVDLLKSIKIGKTRKNKFILIRDSMPFAPAVFASILVTIIVKGNILIYIKSLF